MPEKEVRLIDANEIVKVAEHAYNQWNLAMVGADDTRKVNEVFKKQYLCKVVKAVAENCPTIDPESLKSNKKMIPLYEVYRVIAGHSNYSGDAILSALTCIAEGKDVKPVKPLDDLRPHGKWERVIGDMHSSGYAVRCTNCGKYHFVHYRGSLGGLYGHDELFREPPDCPNCGAKMEG